ncbi:MAG: hypothetical protein KTR22_02075 [Flavobacteriaceae bacterium]|nr:hypothetical protein [Flavobacteriaceae bacterium]
MYTITGAGVALVGDGMTHGYGMVMAGEDLDMDGDGTTHGDGTAGAGVTTDGDGIPIGAMPESVLVGAVIMEIAGAVHLEDIMEEVMLITEVEEDMQVLFEALH